MQMRSLDLPPGILSISPANNSKVVVGDFDIKVSLPMGSIHPLHPQRSRSAMNSEKHAGNQTSSLSGTRDSIVLEGSEFNAELLITEAIK